MKQYQSCEVEIIVWKDFDVITTSGQKNVSKDRFDDEWWPTGGGI